MILIVCQGGDFVLEQPGGSWMLQHPRVRWLWNQIRVLICNHMSCMSACNNMPKSLISYSLQPQLRYSSAPGGCTITDLGRQSDLWPYPIPGQSKGWTGALYEDGRKSKLSWDPKQCKQLVSMLMPVGKDDGVAPNNFGPRSILDLYHNPF